MGRSAFVVAAWSVFALAFVALVSPALAQTYVEDAAATKFNFVSDYGPTFPALASTGADLLQRNMGTGLAVGDVDGDGDLDVLMLDQLGRTNRLFVNELDVGAKRFKDETVSSGLGDTGLSRVAQFADLDNDGDVDLVLVNDDDGSGSYPTSKIYRNDGTGVFTDVTAGSGFDPVGYFRCGLSIADFDGDGLLDLYVPAWTREVGSGSPEFDAWNRVYLNLGSLQFEDVTATNIPLFARDSFGAVIANFDGNLDPDIFVAVDHTADAYYNNVGGRFFDRSMAVGATHTGNDMGLAVGDIDNDLDLDVFASNITDPDLYFGTTQFNAMNVNEFAATGTVYFNDEAGARGVADTYWGWGADFTDADNDGDLDLVVVSGFQQFIALVGLPNSALLDTPSVFFRNNGSGQFTRDDGVGLLAPDDSRALIAFDYDRDGDEDLVVGNLLDPSRLYENTSGQSNNYLSVRLVQRPGLNRDGVGARLLATIGGTTHRRDIVSGESYLSGNAAEAHFGLGSSSTVSPLVIRWTDGTESTLLNVAANQLLTVSQGGVDGDLDGVGDAVDCAVADPAIWSQPPEPVKLRVESASPTGFAWRQPVDSGTTTPTYDLLRSGSATDWSGSTCVEDGTSAITASDGSVPASIYYYLVRIRSTCGSLVGPATAGSRVVPACS
ncbi:MAG: CRTAC1 family protein [Acidobacteriota bacterium]|nr:CRTAC1 family protein [Acidobacteriota bacterium]MDH3784157.1 CRTAC1 family protein [Acidobacteriota bacterium]